MTRLAGKVALVAGGSRGVGATCVRALVAEGAKVVIADIHDQAGKALAVECGRDARYVHLDVTSESSWLGAILFTIAQFRRPNVLVNIGSPSAAGSLGEVMLDAWRETVESNLTAALLGMKTTVASMVTQGGGSIINASLASEAPAGPWAHGDVGAMWGIAGLTKSVAQEFGHLGVRVNALLSADAQTGPSGAVPSHREDLAELVVLLASDESSGTTGESFILELTGRSGS